MANNEQRLVKITPTQYGAFRRLLARYNRILQTFALTKH